MRYNTTQVLWVHSGHKPNMCRASVGSPGGPLVGLGVSCGFLCMRHVVLWWITVVCAGLAYFLGSREHGSGTLPSPGDGSLL